jgi:hypothetical protein
MAFFGTEERFAHVGLAYSALTPYRAIQGEQRSQQNIPVARRGIVCIDT